MYGETNVATHHPPPADLTAFCAAEFPRLVRMLDLLIGDVHVAEELAQETLIRVTGRWSTVRDLDNPGAWARRVARNLATTRWRRRQAARRAAVRTGPIEVVHEDPDLATQHLVRDAMQLLSTPDRTVLVLRHHLGLSIADAANELAISESACKARSARAAVRLRELLAPSHDAKENADV